jgi:ABC-type lipoprotein release transport system permease subunit
MGGLAAARGIESLLYGVAPTDFRVFGFAVTVLLLAAMLSAALPARRASRTDPAVVLRQDAN